MADVVDALPNSASRVGGSRQGSSFGEILDEEGDRLYKYGRFFLKPRRRCEE